MNRLGPRHIHVSLPLPPRHALAWLRYLLAAIFAQLDNLVWTSCHKTRVRACDNPDHDAPAGLVRLLGEPDVTEHAYRGNIATCAACGALSGCTTKQRARHIATYHRAQRATK